MDHLQDKNENILMAVQESLLVLIQYKPTLVDKYLDHIVPTVSKIVI